MSYASGQHAVGECQRCGWKYPLLALRADGYSPGLLVCSTCYEPEQQQEKIVPLHDPVALLRPAPERSVPEAIFFDLEVVPVVDEDPVLLTVNDGSQLRVANDPYTLARLG